MSAPLSSLPGLDWDSLHREAAGLLSAYIRIDTSNPPGNELDAARFFQKILAAEGIESTVHTALPGRGSIMAVLSGEGSRKPLVLLNHTDVVPVDDGPSWDVPPFSGASRDGFIWGRGALDMKGMGILELMAFLIFSRSGMKLSRDLVFLATADEETGGTHGIEHIYGLEPLLSTAAFCINEGGGIRFTGPRSIPCWCIGVAEKVSLRLKITTHGRGGHGSIYRHDNPNVVLLRILSKIESMHEPPTVIPVVKEFFRNIAIAEGQDERSHFLDIEQGLTDSGFDRKFRQNGYYDAMVRNTKVITMLKSGEKINMIPVKASAYLDCRLIPGSSKEDFLGKIKDALLGEPVTIEIVDSGRESPPSPLGSPLYRAIENVASRADPGGITAPFMMTGGSDSSFLRQKGIPCYGFVPFRLPPEEKSRVHGKNERLSLENLRNGMRLLMEIILELEELGAP
ncbi:MAG: M20/M25/M40 family metallo-hydrolase [Candidatus Eremiobacteraeota bacterium]|nr:M20/M25/M40 family metallo-hydrolase [Candidatus Eremiobacteraeota bacterium]